MSTSISEVDSKILSQLVYLDIPEKSSLENKYGANNSITINQLLNFYKSTEGQEALKNRFRDPKEFNSWNEFINGQKDDLSKYSNWQIKNVVTHDGKEESGFVAYTFEPEKGQAIVAFRGSEPLNEPQYRNDWKTDASLVYSTCTLQQKDVRTYMDEYMKNYSEITVTGHSLGGNLSLYAAVALDESIRDKIKGCYSFNGPGFNKEFLEQYKDSISVMNFKIHEFQNKHDLVSSTLFNLTKPIIIDSTLEDTNGFDFNNHSLPFLKIENGTLKRSVPQEKDFVCQAISDFTQRLQTLPNPLLKGMVETVFAIWNGRIDKYDILAAAGILSAVIAFGPFTVAMVVTDIILVALAPEIMKYIVLPTLEKVYQVTKDAVDKLCDNIIQYMKDLLDEAVKAGILVGNIINEFNKLINEEVHNFFDGVASYIHKFRTSTHQVYNYGNININTMKFKELAQRLQLVQNKICNVDRRLDTLFRLVDLDDKLRVGLNDIKVGYNYDLKKCMDYLNYTADRFTVCEYSLGQKAYNV